MKIDYEVLADMVSTPPSLSPPHNQPPTQMGTNCSPRAVQERIKKLRKDAKAGFDSSSPTAPATTASPAKTKTKAAPSKAKKPAAAAAPRGKRGVKAKAAQEDVEDEEGDGGEEEETKAPARKVRFPSFATPYLFMVLTVIQKRKYMDPKTNGPASEPIGRELAEEMGAAYDEAV